jgi:hypothetical protein
MKTILTLFAGIFCQISVAQSIWVDEIVSFNQGLNNDGQVIGQLRSNPLHAIGQAQSSDTPTSEENANYVSLGFGGEIVLKFSDPVKNIEGNDIILYETTFNNPNCRRYPEKVQAFVSQDNCNWYYVGEACQDGEFDLGEMNWAQYIKIIDVSPYGNFEPFGVCDGYDIDGVEGIQKETNPTPTTLIGGSAQKVMSYTPGIRKNGTPITPARTNPLNALGIPQGTEVINFVSLGFGGQLVLKFDFVIFNEDGDDIKITETSYGNPLCSEYPEKALIEVSMDGIHWTLLGEACMDSYIEMGYIKYFQYIRFSDRSPLSQFSSSSDGYDVDGVISLHYCSTQSRVDFDDVITANDDIDVSLSPNPFIDEVIINKTELSNVEIYDYVGKIVKSIKGVTGKIETKDLPNGIYYIKVISKQNTTLHKMFKK